MCAVADDAYQMSGCYFVTIMNMQFGMTVAKLRHATYPVLRLLSFRHEAALVTASQDAVNVWASKGESPLSLFPRIQKNPVEMQTPALEIDLTDCFFKQVGEVFVNLDQSDYCLSVTRQVGQTDKKATYSSYFYAVSQANEGYSHAVSFKLPFAADSVTISPDGLLFLVHTVKNTVHLVNTFDGDMVADVHEGLCGLRHLRSEPRLLPHCQLLGDG